MVTHKELAKLHGELLSYIDDYQPDEISEDELPDFERATKEWSAPSELEEATKSALWVIGEWFPDMEDQQTQDEIESTITQAEEILETLKK